MVEKKFFYHNSMSSEKMYVLFYYYLILNFNRTHFTEDSRWRLMSNMAAKILSSITCIFVSKIRFFDITLRVSTIFSIFFFASLLRRNFFGKKFLKESKMAASTDFS
jgi:hypothetical protein